MVFEESERRARTEVENGQRCAVLQARLEAAHEDAHAEGRRAAAQVEARQSDLQKMTEDSDALRGQLLRLQQEERQSMQQASDAGGAMLAEAHAEAERLAYEVDATREQLKAAKAALKQGSHACLMLKWRSIGTLALRLMLNEWRAAASQIEHTAREAPSADAVKTRWRAAKSRMAALKRVAYSTETRHQIGMAFADWVRASWHCSAATLKGAAEARLCCEAETCDGAQAWCSSAARPLCARAKLECDILGGRAVEAGGCGA